MSNNDKSEIPHESLGRRRPLTSLTDLYWLPKLPERLLKDDGQLRLGQVTVNVTVQVQD